MSDFAYVMANKRIPDLIEKIKSASVPSQFSHEFLKQLGFTSSNDRGFISLFRSLGLTDSTGAPTDRYRELRQNPRKALAKAIIEMYSEALALDEKLPSRSRGDIEGIFTRITDKDETYVKRVASTFSALCKEADFSSVENVEEVEDEVSIEEREEPIKPQEDAQSSPAKEGHIHFRHNIEIHLPATKDISVYNAIFKSIKDNLL
ncbi:MULTISPECIES: DUF5343 domain-containing protein [Pseudomonadota]|uniref:DUF5343 domain-containing protein n=1 Tax=Pseudomonadota TaxID=1224 RepID=UPI003266E110